MKWFRNTLAKNRPFILTTLALCLYGMVGGPDFAYAYQVHQQKEERLQEIADILGIPVEKLRPDHLALAETLGKAFGFEPEDPVKKAGMERLKEVLRKHEEQLATNPYLPQIEQVKNEHAIYRIEGTLQDILQLTDPPGRKALRPQAKQAMMRNLDAAFEEGLELPPLPEGLPAKAHQRHAEMQRKIDRIVQNVRPIVQEAVAEKSGGLNSEKIVQMKQAVGGLLARTRREPRFADRPLPLRRVEKKARVESLSSIGTRSDPSPAATATKTAPQVVSRGGIAPEIVALAAQLDNSPAKIFRHVHDTIEPDLKWGAYRSPLGTLWEKQGSAWDQALLLRDLLVAAGIDVHFEVGQVEITVLQLLEFTGIDDPMQAGNMLATAGVPVVLLASGSQVVAARMPHVWLAAHLDYIPNRGVTHGTPDTWVRIDSYLKEGAVRIGNPVYRNVPFSLMDYLQTASEASPRRVYEDALIVHNVAADLWSDLDEIRYDVKVERRDYPFIPGTLRAKILSVASQPMDVPESARARIELALEKADGSDLLVWNGDAVDLYGRTVEIAYRGATEEDRTLIESYGGILATPPYLVELVPEIRVDGVVAAVGSTIGSAEDVEIRMSLAQPGVGATPRSHVTVAGEHHVLAYDWGRMPTELVERHLERLTTLGSSDPSRTDAERLYLLGSTYLRNLGRDLEDLSAIRWHRLIGLGTQGLITQGGRVTTNVGGVPIALAEDARNVDIAAMTVGMFPATAADRPFSVTTLELLGAQSSYLEGTVFGEVAGTTGIAAVSALTRSKREGQQLHRLDSSNAATVLQTVDLGDDVEEAVLFATSRGQIAWVAEERLALGSWSGTGYVLEDPTTGAAGYMISGGLGGGMELGKALGFVSKALGRESWIADTPLGKAVLYLLQLLGSPPPPSGPEGSHGDPVNLANGNMWTHAADLWLDAPGIPVGWGRTYNSQSTRLGPMGYGWTFSYGDRLEPQANGSIVFIEADGTEHQFSEGSGAFLPPPGIQLRLEETAADGHVLFDPDGGARRFDANGLLVSWSEPNGAGLSFERDPAGALRRVFDSNGRHVLTIDYVDGKISQVADLMGRTATYRYSEDDLIEYVDVDGEAWRYSYDSRHNMIARTDALGNVVQWSYDELDRCYRFVDPLGNVVSYSYDAVTGATVVTDRLGQPMYVETDERGRPTLAVDALGNMHRSTWDQDNNRLTVLDASNGLTTMTYDDNGNVVTATDALGHEMRREFEPGSRRLSRVVEPEGKVTEYIYDADGNLVEEVTLVEGIRAARSIVHDSTGEVVEIRDPEGGVRTFEWDATTGGLTGYTAPNGSSASIVVDDLGRATSMADESGLQVGFDYDSHGQITKISNSRGMEWTREYDALGRLQAEISPAGRRTTEYDALGRVVAQTNENGATIRYEFDAAGNEIGVIDARGNRTRKIYDAVGRPLALIDAAGHVWSVDYVHSFGVDSPCGSCSRVLQVGAYSAGRAAMTVVNPLGERFDQHLDALGRMTEMTNAAGETTHYTYDSAGRKTSETDAEGRVTRWEWSAWGNLEAVIDGEGNRTEYEYDLLGHLVRTIDANGRFWDQSWNVVGQMTSQTDPLAHTETLEHEPFGRVAAKTTANGDIVRYTYDGGLLSRVTLPHDVSEFEYNASGRLVAARNSEESMRFQYDPTGQIVEADDVTLGKMIRYEYDANGNRTRIVGPESTIELFYDVRDFLVEQRDSEAGTFFYDYDAAGRRTAIRFPNGTETRYQYDVAGRLIAVTTRDAEGNLVDGHRYLLDASGLRIEARTLRSNLVQRFKYDGAKRLVRWERGDDSYEEYGYDPAGNRLTLTSPGRAVTYQYDAADRLTMETTVVDGEAPRITEYSWDASGNLLQRTGGDRPEISYEWDALDRLLGVSVAGAATIGYGYAPDGTRVRKTSESGTERYLHNIDDLIGVYDEAGELISYFAFGPEVDQPLAQYKTDSQTLTFLHHDARGSITASSDVEGALVGSAQFTAFGALDEQNGKMSRFGFTAREHESETELDYFRSRYYSPDIGRFISADWFEGSVDNPSTRHDYVYTANDPINHRDPGGRFFGLLLRTFFLFVTVQLGYWIFGLIVSGVARLVVFAMWLVLTVLLGLAVAFLCIYGWDLSGTRPFDCLSGIATMFRNLAPFLVFFLVVGMALELALIFVLYTQGDIDVTLAVIWAIYILVKSLVIYKMFDYILSLKRQHIYEGFLMLAVVLIWSYVTDWVVKLLYQWNPGEMIDRISGGPQPASSGS